MIFLFSGKKKAWAIGVIRCFYFFHNKIIKIPFKASKNKEEEERNDF